MSISPELVGPRDVDDDEDDGDDDDDDDDGEWGARAGGAVSDEHSDDGRDATQDEDGALPKASHSSVSRLPCPTEHGAIRHDSTDVEQHCVIVIIVIIIATTSTTSITAFPPHAVIHSLCA